MQPENRTPERRLTGLYQVSVYEYSDGRNDATIWRMDEKTRRMVPHHLGGVEQPARDPFSPPELLLMAALEHYAQQIDPDIELPW